VTAVFVKNLLWMAGAYLLGSVPTSYLVARIGRGVDLRTFGSQNLGATNLYRLMGFGAAVPVGLFDLLKGTVPVLLAARFAGGPAWLLLLIGVCAVLGHVFSPFVGFRGGKGVATAAGVFLALAPLSLVVAAVVWAAVLKVTGYVSLGSMVAAGAFLASVPFLYPGRTSTLVAAALTFVFIVFTHRTNVRRLLAGTEHRFGTRRPETAP
jgi:glycerol-3-phosphate acyltransferase PlsY